jgi:DNA-binding transcriptional regulator YiaG
MKKQKRTFGQRLIHGATQAAAIARGEAKPARVTRRSIASGATQVHEPPRYDAKQIRRLRESLNVSQAVFARILNSSDATVKAWEQGQRLPDGISLRLLELIEKAPDVFRSIVGLPGGSANGGLRTGQAS